MLSHVEKNYSPGAVVINDLQQTVSSQQVLFCCHRLIHHLLEAGVKSVGLCATNSIDWILVDLACQHEDILILPIPTFFTPKQISHALMSCQLDAVITDDLGCLSSLCDIRYEHLGTLAGTDLELVKFPKNLSDPKPNSLPEQGRKNAVPDGTGKITFTSGSTGQPKGVCLHHGQLLQQAEALAQSVNIEAPRHLCLLPLSTLLENVAGNYGPILSGGEIIVPHPESMGFSGSALLEPEQMLSAISSVRPDSLILVPQLLLLIVAAIRKGWQCPQSLKFIAVGGGKVSKELIIESQNLGLPVYEVYGLSECGSVVSLNTPKANSAGSCGLPLSHIELQFEEGEVLVSGNSMLGYANEPDSWNPEFISTGDLGFQDEQGFLHITGRKKNLLISSLGRNISPEWVESELLSGPVLAEVVVVGDDRPYCSALVLPRSDQLSDEELQSWVSLVNAKLPDYARVNQWHRMSASLAERGGLLTENGRPKRENINSAYAEAIDAMYAAEFLSPELVPA